MNERLYLYCQSVLFRDQEHHNTHRRRMRTKMSIPFLFDFSFNLVAFFFLLVPEVRKNRASCGRGIGDGVEEPRKGYIKVVLEGKW
jgi:hypothetical protein